MKIIFLLYYLTLQTTVISASNQYLGCFIDRVGDRDLSLFVGDYETLTPSQCIRTCREQNFPYAAVQYRTECRCDRKYGKYGQVSDDQCNYLCPTLEKCGGDYRNSVYDVLNSIDTDKTGSTCGNNLIGYQGCFDSSTLQIKMNSVNSIEECVKRCAVEYDYAGITNGNLCYCGTDINQRSSHSELCNIRCTQNSMDCCGGSQTLSIYNTKYFQSSSLKDQPEILNRAVNDSTDTTALVTDTSSISTAVTSIPLSSSTSQISTASTSMMTNSSSDNTTQAVPLTTNSINNTFTSVDTSLTSSTLISSISTAQSLTTNSNISTNTAITLIVSDTTSNSTNLITNSQSTNSITIALSSSGTNTITSTISSNISTLSLNTSTNVTVPSSITTEISTSAPNSSVTSTLTLPSSQTSSGINSTASITSSQISLVTIAMNSTENNTITSTISSIVSTSSFNTSTNVTIPSSVITETSTSASSLSLTSLVTTATNSTENNTITSTISSIVSTVSSNISTNITIPSSVITETATSPSNSSVTSTLTVTSNETSPGINSTASMTSSQTSLETSTSMSTNFTSNFSLTTQSINSTDNETTVTGTTTIQATSSPSVSNASTSISETTSSLSNSSLVMSTESQSTSPITSTQSNQIATTVSEQTSSASSSSSTSFLFTSVVASNSTNVETQTTNPSSSLHTDINNGTTVSTQSTVTVTVAVTSVSGSNTTTITTTTIAQPASVAASSVITTVFIVPFSQNFTPTNNATIQAIRIGIKNVVNLALLCSANITNPACVQVMRRRKRQSCSSGYDVDLVSGLTLVSTLPLQKYSVDYTVNDLCNSNAVVAPAIVRSLIGSLSRQQISEVFGYDYDGDFVRSTSIENTTSATPDRKLWLIGAVLGPVAFVLLLIFVCCFLHYKCRPRPNQGVAKTVYNAPQTPTRSSNYKTILNESVTEKATTEKNLHAITQANPLISTTTSSQRLTVNDSEKSLNHTPRTPRYPASTDISMDEIRRQNDVERWRNKLRLQEKFQQSSIEIHDSSAPNTNRSMPIPYDNQAYEHDPSTINIQPANEIVAKHLSRRMPQTTEVARGRTKLHRLLDEVLDKADSDEGYNPDSEIERLRRRRQRRRGLSISDDHRNVPTQQIPHIPVIPQVYERPDPSLVRLRYNPYEAGDRAHDISRIPPVVLKPKYETDDQRNAQYSSRSNPPLFYDDTNIPDRAATATDAFASPKRFGQSRLETDREATMRHDGGQIERRQHKFTDDAVYIDTVRSNRNGYRAQARPAWADPEIDHESSGRNDYLSARQSVANTRNIISSINNNLQHIGSPSEDYHA